MTLSAGTRLGPYEILSPLGVGGMGEVYRAKDTRLARDVAVKVLPEEFFEGEEKRQRFEREARLLASLTHPNVAAVYSFEEISGRHLLVMELIEGETLRAQLAEGTLPMKKILRIAAQVAEGLAKAHGAGIVHRDLKPENVIVTRDGFAKILDFGLAKVTTTEAGPSGETTAPTLSKMTEPGTVMGTVAYMSPEQALGRPVDFRSDLFSFGSVLYEMVTGWQAFARASAPETMTAIIREEPERVGRAAAGVPAGLRWIVERCLAKDPDERYGSTRDLARDLAQLGDGTPETGGLSPQAGSPAIAGAAGLPSVAVLPFVNMSADPENEFFADGITEDVIAHLAKIRTLRVTSRTSAMAFKTREKSLREIGAALGVGMLVQGSVRRSKNRVRIVAQLVDPRTDEHVWTETYDRDLDDIFAIQTDVALHIAAVLRAELTLDERVRIGRRPTHDLEAYQIYLQGRHHFQEFTKAGSIRGLALFEQAVARDPLFALAYAGIAQSHTEGVIGGISGVVPGEAFARAQQAVDRALALDEGLAEAQRALALDASYPRLHTVFGWACMALGRTAEGLAALERAVELSPDSTLFLAQLGQARGQTGDVARARAILGELEVLAETQYVAAYHLAHVHTGLGERDAALDCLERAFEQRSGAIYGIKGSYLFARLRDHPRFQALLRRMNL